MAHQSIIDLYGEYPGHDLDLAGCEALLHTRWERKERLAESGLMQAKWFDYRVMHPAACTYLFGHMLTQQTRAIIRAHLNNAPAIGNKDWHPIKSGDIFEPPTGPRLAYWQRKIKGLIRARQAADRDGIPYDHFIATGLKHFYFGAGTYVLHKTGATFPEPNLLYGDECLTAIRSSWLEQVTIRVQAAKHPRYLLENDDGHPDHQAHRDWLEQQLAMRASPELARKRLVREGLLPA